MRRTIILLLLPTPGHNFWFPRPRVSVDADVCEDGIRGVAVGGRRSHSDEARRRASHQLYHLSDVTGRRRGGRRAAARYQCFSAARGRFKRGHDTGPKFFWGGGKLNLMFMETDCFFGGRLFVLCFGRRFWGSFAKTFLGWVSQKHFWDFSVGVFLWTKVFGEHSRLFEAIR